MIIVFFTFDALLAFGFIILIAYMLFNGISETITMIVANYEGIMRTVFIISLIIAIVLGIFFNVNFFDDDEKKLKKGSKFSITPAIFNAFVVPPVIMFSMQETLGFLDNFSGSGGIFYLIFFGFIFLILYVIAVSLELLIGLGIPTLISLTFQCIGGIGGKIGLLLSGAGISVLYYLVLNKSNIFPFATSFVN